MQIHPEDYNVLFVTLCSCTLETAKNSDTPNLNKISKLKEAETVGTYTYPSHHSFFIGHLPELKNDKYYFQKYGRIWRSISAWKTGKQVAIWYDQNNILDYYKERGFDVFGFGGVGFFNTYDSHNSLPKLFDKFKYFGDNKRPVSKNRVPRQKSYFPLNNIDKILKNVSTKKQFFIFINCPETHIPYDNPETKNNKDYSKIIEKLYLAHYTKRIYAKNILFDENEINIIKKHQVESLEWIDKQLGILIEKLPKNKPLLVLVCSDHGEEFGEGGRFGHIHFHKNIMEVPLWCGVINNKWQKE